MGGWDVNCAFCGAGFSIDDPWESNDDGEVFDPDLISEQELDWVGKFQVIGSNPNSFTVDKCYITGSGRTPPEYGYASCERGSDSSVPHGQGDFEVSVYRSYEVGEQLNMPFHQPCLGVFTQALKYQLSGQVFGLANAKLINKDRLYTAMSALHTGPYDHFLNVDYAELNDAAHEQYWMCYPGHEAWVSNPYENANIFAFYETLHSDTATALGSRAASTKSSSLSPMHFPSHFSGLSNEIMLEIFLNLSYQEVRSFVLSGLASLDVSQCQGFWRRRILVDLPFLWDFPKLDGRRNFFTIYQELRRQCFATTPSTYQDEERYTHVKGPRDKTLVLALANRRRVWNACSEIAKLYVKHQEEQRTISGKSQTASEEIISNSVSLQTPLVASPASKDFRPVSTYFLSSWEDLEKEHTFAFHFNNDGYLSCIEVGTPEKNDSNVIGQKPQGGVIVEVALVAGEWIRGFELNMWDPNDMNKDAKIGITGLKVYLDNGNEKQLNNSIGGKRRMIAGEGMVITGAVAEISDHGVFQRFGLLQCPRNLASTNPPSISQIEKTLWKDSLPPSGLTASTSVSGYWKPIRPLELVPSEALIFGTSDEELSKVTGFSSNPTKSSFTIHYESGMSKSIGNADVVEDSIMFKIDGHGGERITKVDVGINHLPVGIKITTNRGRHCFFGNTQKNEHTAYEPSNGLFVAGIYASWGYRSGQKAECTTISILSGSKSEQEGLEVVGVSGHGPWAPAPRTIHPRYPNPDIVCVEHDCNDPCANHW